MCSLRDTALLLERASFTSPVASCDNKNGNVKGRASKWLFYGEDVYSGFAPARHGPASWPVTIVISTAAGSAAVLAGHIALIFCAEEAVDAIRRAHEVYTRIF